MKKLKIYRIVFIRLTVHGGQKQVLVSVIAFDVEITRVTNCYYVFYKSGGVQFGLKYRVDFRPYFH
jgi:hypothetical protein